MELNNFLCYNSNSYQELPLYDNKYTYSENVICCPQFTPEYRCFLFRCYTLIFIFWGVMIYFVYYLVQSKL